MLYPDEELAGRIEEALLMNPNVSRQEFQVSAHEHVVTLRGTVPSAERKNIALFIAQSVPMCRGVVDEVRVDPCSALPDDEVSARAARQLESVVPCVRDAVRVSVKEGVATITGAVPTEWERMVVADVVFAARGVRSLVNRVRTNGAYDIPVVKTPFRQREARRPPKSRRATRSPR